MFRRIDLHRAGNVPDWEKVAPEDRNKHQVRAAKTNGWDTPGNRWSLAGFLASVAGMSLLRRKTRVSAVAGTVLLAAGRYCDLRDGKEADKTGTKSRLGANVDAFLDSSLAVIGSILLPKAGVISKAEAAHTFKMTTIKAVASGVSLRRGLEPNTSVAGKDETFLRWGRIAVGCLAVTAEQFGNNKLTQSLQDTAEMLRAIDKPLHEATTAGYVMDAMAPVREAPEQVEALV